MSCYNCCTRVNLTSQLLLTKGKHADSHWNKPEHRFALWFTIWEGWERGLFQDVGHALWEKRPLSPSLPLVRQAFPAQGIKVSQTPENSPRGDEGTTLPSTVFFQPEGDMLKGTLLPQGQRSSLWPLLRDVGSGFLVLGGACAAGAGMQMIGLAPSPLHVLTLTSYQIWEQSKNKYLEIIPILWFLIFNFINFFQVLNPDRFIYASGRLFDSHRSQYSLVLHHQTKNW